MANENTYQDRRSYVLSLIYGDDRRRFTQDSPVLPDVWLEYAEIGKDTKKKEVPLLLTPYFGSKPGLVSVLLRDKFGKDLTEQATISYNETYVAININFNDLIRIALPLTTWWKKYFISDLSKDLAKSDKKDIDETEIIKKLIDSKDKLIESLEVFLGNKEPSQSSVSLDSFSSNTLWLIRLVGALAGMQSLDTNSNDFTINSKDVVTNFLDLFKDYKTPDNRSKKSSVYLINLNRKAQTAINQSSLAVKADAARRLFEVDCSKLSWAILDSGLDASHPAFLKKKAVKKLPNEEKIDLRKSNIKEEQYLEHWKDYTRIIGTYDFTRIRKLQNLFVLKEGAVWLEENFPNVKKGSKKYDDLLDLLKDQKSRVDKGSPIDWSILEDLLKVEHDENYIANSIPQIEHGTHVAGILGGYWPDSGGGDLIGICPDINLYDFRVIGTDESENQEFNVLAALQFIDYLNDQKDYYAIHGVNLSLALRHDVANFACGRTPVCDESERLVSSGVCVIAAAGNGGYQNYKTSKGIVEGYQTVSITDPGNSEKVITVGSTHRFQPHTYGVSYFSSRGPTGDGRSKPDLVAPGEKITSPVPNREYKTKDGTSMAAPHVSGAAAILMARHNELIGQPMRIKEILCNSATDLGREKYFQGAGMLDILRAIQSV